MSFGALQPNGAPLRRVVQQQFVAQGMTPTS
jgi:hypothetical protein